MRDELRLFINGLETRIGGAAVFMTLAEYLREVRGATGTKVVCAEGDCGACTVLAGTPDGDALAYRPVNSCIQLLFQLDGSHVVTVEGLGSGATLSAVQQSMVDHNGAQCGYCTPGFVVAMTALAEGGKPSGVPEIRQALTGNLCRCTGYEPIINAALGVGNSAPRIDELYPPAPIARALSSLSGNVRIEGGGRRFYSPSNVDSAVKLLAENPDTVIVQGGTDFGVLWNKRGIAPRSVMTLNRIAGIDSIEIVDGSLIVGSRATLAALETFSKERLPELHRILERFGSPQIRNAGTLAGNIANASPIADTLPFLFVCGAQIELASSGKTRTVNINSFYKGYKLLDKAADELITRVVVPLPAPDETLRLFKVSKRRDLDISTFTAAIRMKISGGRMSGVRIAYGGVAPVVLRLPGTEAFLEGRESSEESFRKAGPIARAEIAPISDVRGSKEFRSLLAENILMKFYWESVASKAEVAR